MMVQKTSHKTVPVNELVNPLSQERIIKLLINAIHQYKQQKITLTTLTTLSSMILKSNNPAITDSLRKILDEIHSLTVVDNLLTDILEELKQKY